jgi:probable rRNA maturation factor
VTSTLDITVQAKGWAECAALAKRAVEAAAAELDSPREGELSLVLSDDAQVRILNRTYRQKDTPTNVLSFPQTGPLLGDIVLARETLLREAAEKHVSFEAHLTHLIIHGWLHLQGFDHQTEAEAQEMEAVEIAALRTLGIDNPYQVSDD